MSTTFIPLSDVETYLDPRLWKICGAAILQSTHYSQDIDTLIAEIESLSPTISELTTVIEYHGLSGLTHSLLKEYQIDVPLPANLVIKASSVKHAQRWQAIVKVLVHIQKNIDKEIRFCLLKGSALTTQIYAEPFHRAMSDIDLICAPENVESFFQQCLEFGFTGSTKLEALKDHHHLPAISKKEGQHQIALEIHTHALSFDLPEQLAWDDFQQNLRSFNIGEERFLSLPHEEMLFQLSSHAFARDQVIKLSNLVDIFRYAIIFEHVIDWNKIEDQFSKVITTMRYSRLLLDLPENVLPQIKPIPKGLANKVTGLGESMLPLRELSNTQINFVNRLHLLFFPSLWWQLIFYNIQVTDSTGAWQGLKQYFRIGFVRFFKHPMKVAYWIVTKTVKSN